MSIADVVTRGRTADVTIAIQGGLGNQLFQWAFATSLRQDGVQVRFDTVRCRGDRPLAIGPLLDGFTRGSTVGALTRAAAHRHAPGWLELVEEGEFGFDEELAELARAERCYVAGYFQSPRYFENVAENVRRLALIFLESSLTPTGADFADELSRENSIAVHVRRGDYVTNPVAAGHHGALKESYYDRALGSLRPEPSARVIWFSDDLEWTRNNLAAPGDQVCPSGLTTGAGGEIALMAACRTRIIANSSFSWWAGWLGAQADHGGRVFAPRRWFVNDEASTHDLLPESWVRL